MSQVIEATLDAIIKVTDLNGTTDTNVARYLKIIAKVFSSINADIGDVLANRGNFIERAVSIDYNINCHAEKPNLF